jgi:DNA-binding transcriptional MerR regulator
MKDVLTSGEVARSGVATSALRFYEARGLIRSERTLAAHRRYPRAVIRRVSFIVFAQRLGLSLDEIGAALARLPANRVPDRSDWTRLSAGVSGALERGGAMSPSESCRVQPFAPALSHQARTSARLPPPARDHRKSSSPTPPRFPVL